MSAGVAGVGASRATPLPDDAVGREMAAHAQRVIASFHGSQRTAPSLLRVVYFHPRDREPLPLYAERLDRALTDISDFYRDGLRRLGIENDGLPLERRQGRVVFHLVRGQKPASGYKHESGDAIAAEIRTALQGTFDLNREHVLVLYALCRKEPDGRYVFDAPYYGGGSQRNGWRGRCTAIGAAPVLFRPGRLRGRLQRAPAV